MDKNEIVMVLSVDVLLITRLHYSENGTSIMVRGCGLDSGSLTSDTELVRISHCGAFILGKE